jgi:hypothetical protein
MPRFIGKWIPDSSKADSVNLHAATILLIFKPWRCLAHLKASSESFLESYDLFMTDASVKLKAMIEHMQYYHECWDVAQKHQDTFKTGEMFPLFDYERSTLDLNQDDNHDEENMPCHDNDNTSTSWVPQCIDDDMIERVRREQKMGRDLKFAEGAMLVAASAKVFDTPNEGPARKAAATIATREDIAVISGWEVTLRDMTRRQNDEEGQMLLTTLTRYAQQTILPLVELINEAPNSNNANLQKTSNTTAVSMRSPRPKLAILNADQKKAHDIIECRIFPSKV